eukprot:1137770-Pelagomonas_calceolata.AAC.4
MRCELHERLTRQLCPTSLQRLGKTKRNSDVNVKGAPRGHVFHQMPSSLSRLPPVISCRLQQPRTSCHQTPTMSTIMHTLPPTPHHEHHHAHYNLMQHHSYCCKSCCCTSYHQHPFASTTAPAAAFPAAAHPARLPALEHSHTPASSCCLCGTAVPAAASAAAAHPAPPPAWHPPPAGGGGGACMSVCKNGFIAGWQSKIKMATFSGPLHLGKHLEHAGNFSMHNSPGECEGPPHPGKMTAGQSPEGTD